MNLSLNQKVILISGGAKGIGAAVAKGLIEEGGIPVIIDPSGEEARQIIDFANNQALHLPLRLVRAADASRAVEETLRKFGRIDGIVNNAGS
ncbi:MAG TPA: short-chain dehydrogenase, partial [Algoriphagus sp.]|nr:short-chain dehydrogenase [Algoriphagus sp.]